MAIRIWINRAGPSKIHAVKMLKENYDGDPVEVIVTRPNPDGAVRTVADEYHLEPDWDTSDEDYGRWAVQFAKERHIDVLLPTCRISALADRRGDFGRIGTRLAIGVDPVAARILDSKVGTYAWLEEVGLSHMAPAHDCISGDSPRDAAIALRNAFWHLAPFSDNRMVVKCDTGWSADSFRILTSRPKRVDEDSMFSAMGPIVDLEDYGQALIRYGEKKELPGLIAMPYLTDEVSVDVLARHGEPLIMVPRTKSGRDRYFHASTEVMSMTEVIVRTLKLDSLTNIQFRHLNGHAYLLEINPRGAAGLYHTAATGVNMYWETVKAALSMPSKIPAPDLGARVQVLDFAVEM